MLIAEKSKRWQKIPPGCSAHWKQDLVMFANSQESWRTWLSKTPQAVGAADLVSPVIRHATVAVAVETCNFKETYKTKQYS